VTTYETIKVLLQEYGSMCIKVSTDVNISFTTSFSDDGINYDYNAKTNVSPSFKPIITSVILGRWCKLSVRNSTSSNANIRFSTYCQTNSTAIQPQITTDNTKFPSVNIDNLNGTLFNDLRIAQRRSVYDHQFVYGSVVANIYTSPDRDIDQFSGGGINLTLSHPVTTSNTLCLCDIPKSVAGSYLGIMGQTIVYTTATPIYCTFNCGFKTDYVDSVTLGFDNMLCGLGYVDGSGNVIDGVFIGFPSAPQAPDTVIDEICFIYYGSGIEYYIPQSRWAFDQLDGNSSSGITLDYTKLSTWRIRLTQITSLYLEYHNPFDNQWVPVHRIPAENLFDVPIFLNPSFGFCAYMKRTSTATDSGGTNINGVYMVEGDVGVEESELTNLSRLQTYEVIGSVIAMTASTNTDLLSVIAGTLLNTVNNRSLIFPKFLSISSDGTAPCIITISRRNTYTTPTWTYEDSTHSPMAKLTAGSVNFGTGYDVASYFNGKIDISFRNIDGYNLFLSNNQNMMISAFSTATSTIQAILTYAILV
jgi:hypothetical protein